LGEWFGCDLSTHHAHHNHTPLLPLFPIHVPPPPPLSPPAPFSSLPRLCPQLYLILIYYFYGFPIMMLRDITRSVSVRFDLLWFCRKVSSVLGCLPTPQYPLPQYP
jgi:hypothetical protein